MPGFLACDDILRNFMLLPIVLMSSSLIITRLSYYSYFGKHLYDDLAETFHPRILTEGGIATAKRNSDVSCSHLNHLTKIRAHDFLHLSHTFIVPLSCTPSDVGSSSSDLRPSMNMWCECRLSEPEHHFFTIHDPKHFQRFRHQFSQPLPKCNITSLLEAIHVSETKPSAHSDFLLDLNTH
jgi:hypothetical protein